MVRINAGVYGCGVCDVGEMLRLVSRRVGLLALRSVGVTFTLRGA